MQRLRVSKRFWTPKCVFQLLLVIFLSRVQKPSLAVFWFAVRSFVRLPRKAKIRTISLIECMNGLLRGPLPPARKRTKTRLSKSDYQISFAVLGVRYYMENQIKLLNSRRKTFAAYQVNEPLLYINNNVTMGPFFSESGLHGASSVVTYRQCSETNESE